MPYNRDQPGRRASVRPPLFVPGEVATGWNPQEKGSRIMPTVTVDGEKSFEVEAGKKLVLAIEDAGIDILHRCGGNARCTTCRVEVLGGEVPPPAELERERLALEADLAPNIRLSCQNRVNSDLWVAVVNRSSVQGIPPGPRPVD
jgi:ferredoxin